MQSMSSFERANDPQLPNAHQLLRTHGGMRKNRLSLRGAEIGLATCFVAAAAAARCRRCCWLTRIAVLATVGNLQFFFLLPFVRASFLAVVVRWRIVFTTNKKKAKPNVDVNEPRRRRPLVALCAFSSQWGDNSYVEFLLSFYHFTIDPT